MSNRKIAAVVGAIFWGGGAIALTLLAGSQGAADGTARRVPRQLARYWTTPYTRFEVTLPEVPARSGDAIFIQDEAGVWQQAGFLEWTDGRASATEARAVWHYEDVSFDACSFEYHRNRGKFKDVVQMLLPPDKRDRIQALIRETVEQHGDEITAALRPIVSRSLKESMPVVEAAFRQSIRDHRGELEALGDRYQVDVLERRLMPLVKEEVLPIVRMHGEPVAKMIGRELWDRASLWRFAWRGIYDKSPLPERDLLRQEWERYLDEEAVPVVEKYSPMIIEAQKEILKDIARNERIREELRYVAEEVAADRELQQLVGSILQDTFLENDALREVWLRNWQNAEAKAALDLAGKRLEPLVRKIGDELFGTRDGGISPSFARVLRNQILGKDKRWLVAIPHGENREVTGTIGSTLPVRLASESIEFPMIVLASPEPPEVN